jgi:large subunit ribosomal protein L32
MPEPKKQTTSSKGKIRRKAKSQSLPKLVECEKCQEKKLPHRVCPNCGHYGEEKIRKDREKKEKEE